MTIGGQKKLISCKRAVDIPRITPLCLHISDKTGLRTLDLGRKYATMVSSFTTGHGKTGEENVMFKLAVLQYALIPRPQQDQTVPLEHRIRGDPIGSRKDVPLSFSGTGHDRRVEWQTRRAQ